MEEPRLNRRSIRLAHYDYSQAGAYFVTICTQDRVCCFGEIVDCGLLDPAEVRLTPAGAAIQAEWLRLPERFVGLELDEFVIMPNHIHGILILPDHEPEALRAPTRGAPTLGTIVGAFKSLSTNAYAQGVRAEGWPPFPGRLWQRNYYEHIIRNEASLDQIRDYIRANPARWADDMENPHRS